MKHIFIINPKAGKRSHASRIFSMAEGLRQAHNLDCSCMLTQSPGHATYLARKAAESGEAVRLYACGGDGTLHEVANGAAGFDNAAVTCIPMGTGNDFLKNFGEDQALFADAENLWDGDTFPIDLIDCNGRCCVTIACSGIDARVAADVHTYGKYPLLSGRGSYLASVAVNFLFKGIGRRWTVTIDGESLTDDFALVTTCNGRYYGGGSTPVPQARMDDGILETILIKKVDRTTFARFFAPYSVGQYARFPELARVVQAREVHIHSEDEEIVTCLDGECFRAHDVTIRLSDKRLHFFGPKGCDCNRTAR